jgi:hypothetical protein
VEQERIRAVVEPSLVEKAGYVVQTNVNHSVPENDSKRVDGVLACLARFDYFRQLIDQKLSVLFTVL